MFNWLRNLLELDTCKSCELLAQTAVDTRDFMERQIAILNEDKRKLLDTIIELQVPKIQPTTAPSAEIKPILPGYKSWRVKQQMLEAEDAQKAKLQREAEKEQAEINKLEKELNLDATEHSAEQNSTS